MNVLFSVMFNKLFHRLPKSDKFKITAFVFHVQTQGLTNLQGRNKPSHEVPTNDAQWLQKVRYAREHNLWHYHIGIPCYDDASPNGNKTSKYVLHYIRGSDFIRLVDLSEHPPFQLPKPEYLV